MTNDERCRERAVYEAKLGQLELQSKLMWEVYRAVALRRGPKRIAIDCPRYKRLDH